MSRIAHSLVGIAACLVFVPGCSAPTVKAESTVSSDWIVVDRSGQGSPIFFVPGLTSSPDVFDAAISTVDGTKYKIGVAGFADTPAATSTGSVIEPVTDALVAYMNENDLQDVSLVGHSMGGLVSLLVAAKTDRVSRVLVVDAVPFLPGLFQPGATPEIAAGGRNALENQMAALSDEGYLAIVRQGLSRQAIDEAARARIFDDAERSDVSTAKTVFVEMMSTDYTPQLLDISARVTVLAPFDGTLGFPEDAVRARYEAQYAKLPNVEIRLVDMSRHFIMLDAPDAFATELSHYLLDEGH